MSFKIEKAERQKVKIKIGLKGASGSGKTMGAILIAKGLTDGDLSKVVLIDTENRSASLYSHLGEFKVINFGPPFEPERYIEAIEVCEKSGVEVVILDSISHEWEGESGILDIHSKMGGNSFTAWKKLTPRHNRFIQKLLQVPMHIIATMRAKQDYVLNEKNGKQVPEKVGMKGITREGMDYEFTTVLHIEQSHLATGEKDRTGLFPTERPFTITEQTGEKIISWCNDGIEAPSLPARSEPSSLVEQSPPPKKRPAPDLLKYSFDELSENVVRGQIKAKTLTAGRFKKMMESLDRKKVVWRETRFFGPAGNFVQIQNTIFALSPKQIELLKGFGEGKKYQGSEK